MRSISLKWRFILLSMGLSFFLISAGYLSVYFFSKDHYLSYLSQVMLDRQTLFDQPQKEILKLGIPDSDLKAWLESEVLENGFLVSKGEKRTLYFIRKNSNQTYNVDIGEVSFLKWVEVLKKHIFLLFAVMSLFLGLISFFYLFVSLKPLSELRKVTEDILAGRHDMRLTYLHGDEVGRISTAVNKLIKDLEKKDVILEQYTELATTDGMTGLKNHRYFKEQFQREISLCQRHKDICGLILLDVDHFKKFNDTYGHQQGDEVLRHVAQTLRRVARTTDIVARYGGEEFVLVLPKTDGEGLKIVGEKLRKAMEETKIPYLAKPGEFLSVTASFGVVSIIGENLKDLTYTLFVEAADTNLYSAKKKGRNCVVFSEWDPA